MPVIDINRERCSACNLGVGICHMDVLRVAEEGAPVIACGEDCQSCYLCGRCCPEGAIVLTPCRARPSRLPFQPPQIVRGDHFFSKGVSPC